MQLSLILLVLVGQDSTVAAARVSRTKRPEKPINWNLSYYSEPFGLCKTLRKFNPVEQARAHGVAVDVFRKCGPNLVIPYATRFNFPAYAIVKAGEFICFLFNVVGTYFNLGTQLKVDIHDDVDDIMREIRKFCGVMDRGGWRIIARHRGKEFLFLSYMCNGFVCDVIECGLRKVGNRNVEVAKYAVGHYLKMLL